MSFNRRRIFVKGLGGPLQVRLTDPSVETSFSDVGFIESVIINDVFDMEDIFDVGGRLIDTLPRSRKVGGRAEFLQSSKVELDLIRNAEGKIYAARYSGLAGTGYWQAFVFDQCRINPNLTIPFKVGKRTTPMEFSALNQQDATSDIPEYYFVETADEIRLDGLQLWVSPRLDLQVGTVRLLDISGFIRTGTINSDYATIWTAGSTPVRFLRLDGVNDQVSFGNILSMNATDDWFFEKWVRVQAADGTNQECLSKKSAVGNALGYSIERLAANTVRFQIGDGSANAAIVSSATVLQNVWKLIGVHIDRNGNGQVYLNGVADGSPVSVAAIGTAASSDNLLIGALGAANGQIDSGDMRIYNFGSDGLPSDIATIAARHFTAERAFYGV